MSCLHVKFHTLDFANQPQRYPGHCPLCQLEAAESKLSSQAKELWDALEREVALTSRLDLLETRERNGMAQVAELEDDLARVTALADARYSEMARLSDERDAALNRATQAELRGALK